MSEMTASPAEAAAWEEAFLREHAHLLPQLLAAKPEPMQAHHSVLTHNGTFTIHSARTGDHRTFRVKTQPADARFAPGKRVVSLLVGPDNTNDYQQFAFVDETGEVVPWSRYRGTDYERHCHVLQDLQRHIADGAVTVFVSCRCRVCNRTLTTPESVRSGIGPICDGRS